jgi:hypothetical protein
MQPLTPDECDGIVTACKSVFVKLKNAHAAIAPIMESFGFRLSSPSVIARDLSEKVEVAIVQHCTSSFSKGKGHSDLARMGEPWEVKVCQKHGLTINQSKAVNGEQYIVVNYEAGGHITRIWVLWNAEDAWFSPRRSNTNARSLRIALAKPHIESLYQVDRKTRDQQTRLAQVPKPHALKTTLPSKSRTKTA